jgi:hypothetical protein
MWLNGIVMKYDLWSICLISSSVMCSIADSNVLVELMMFKFSCEVVGDVWVCLLILYFPYFIIILRTYRQWQSFKKVFSNWSHVNAYLRHQGATALYMAPTWKLSGTKLYLCRVRFALGFKPNLLRIIQVFADRRLAKNHTANQG